MAWTFLAELEDSPLLWHHGSTRSPIVKTIDMHALSYCPECDEALFHLPLSGTTCERCWGGLVPVPIDIISAGFPCQDISYAGTGKGLGGKRSSLFFEVLRLSEEILPAFIFLENVPAIRTRGADVVGEELAKRGYDSRWLVASASHFGARHERRRWFCLATNSNRFRFRDEWERSTEGKTKTTRKPWHHGPARPLDRWSYLPSWTTESEMDRVVDGASRRMDRLRALGNGVVPVQAREAFAHLMGLRGVV